MPPRRTFGRLGYNTALRQLPRNVWVVTVASFLTDVSSEMLFNLLPLFLANVLGLGTGVIGFIEGLAEATASLLKILSGWFSDRLGQRKRLAVLGYALSTASKPFLAVAGTWPAILAVRFADRVGKGIRTSPRDALIADSVDPGHRGTAFGLHRAGDTAGAAVGLALAAFVVWRIQGLNLTLSRGAFQTVVLVSLVPAALAVVVLALGAKEPSLGAVARAGISVRRLPSSIAQLDPTFRRFVLIIFLFSLGNSSDAFIVLRAQERGQSVLGVLAMLFAFNAVYATVSGPAGRLSDRVGRRRLLLIGWSLYTVVYLGLAAAENLAHVWLLVAAYGVYYGLAEGTGRAYVADLVPAAERGAAYGVYHAAVGLAVLPASLFAGLLWQGVGPWSGFGPAAPFMFGAMMALGATILLARATEGKPILTD